MLRPLKNVLILTSVIFIGCKPIAYTIDKPSGMSTFVECEKDGDTITAKFAISPIKEDSPCQAIFEEGEPENLQVIATNGAARVSWKIGKSHFKQIGIQPYKFKLMTSSGNYSITIAFKTTAQQITSPFLFSFIRFI